MKNLSYYINKALKNHFALGAINFTNLESLQAIVSACKNLRSPAILAVSESSLKYMEEDYLISMVKCAKKRHNPLFLHLDHGKDFEICKKAIDLGFDSVMIDGSSLPFDDNIALTKKVVDYAHKKNIIVEGELGQLKGIEDDVSSENHHFTDAKQAKIFVEKTNVDMLAVAIGTSHGAYKYSGKQTLRFDVLSEIEKQLPSFPLVLHGASTVDNGLIQQINDNVGEINNASGIPVNLLCECVKNHNIIKINTDTDLRLAMTAQIRTMFNNDASIIDPRKYLGEGREAIRQLVELKIKNIFFSDNQI